jgi:hypothetical protein
MRRTASSLSSSELRKRLTAIGYSQKTFARHAGLSLRHVHRIVVGELPVPSFVHRLLLCAEAMHALSLLAKSDAERVSKRRMQAIVEATHECITATPPPEWKRKAQKHKRTRNLLSAKHLPQPDPALIPEIDREETWTALASRIGPDAAAELHRKLAARRPRSLGRPSGDAEAPIARTTDPI